MKITIRQAHVLENLHRIEFRRVRDKRRPFLDGEDCRYQLVTLGAKRLVVWDGLRPPTKIADHDGIVAEARGSKRREREIAGRQPTEQSDGPASRPRAA